MTECAVVHCTASLDITRHASGMSFCPFHREWYAKRYLMTPTTHWHARQRLEVLELMHQDAIEHAIWPIQWEEPT